MRAQQATATQIHSYSAGCTLECNTALYRTDTYPLAIILKFLDSADTSGNARPDLLNRLPLGRLVDDDKYALTAVDW